VISAILKDMLKALSMRVMKYRGGDKMALSGDFKEAVLQNKKTKVRIMMKDSLLLDITGAEFDEMLSFAQKFIPDLLDVHDGEVFIPANQWNEDYLNEQMVAVVNNFSEERIEQLKKMVKKLYVKSEANASDIQKTVSNIESNRAKANVNGVKVAGGVVAAVGTGILVYGLAAKTSVVVPVVGGVAIIAGACMLLKKE
jgi:hypothetical protein